MTRVSANEALGRLLQGNRRFAGGAPMHPRQDSERRTALAAAQHPYAAILTCADSRVTPELVFDQGFGDLFVVRNGGNIGDEIAAETLEFAVATWAVPLIVVMGHQNCGAVAGTLAGIDAGIEPGRLFGEIRRAIMQGAFELHFQPKVHMPTGRVIGALTAILIVMKGLPLAYAKDMQEDKQGAMDALAALSLSIAAMAGMVTDLAPDTAKMKKAAGEGYSTATDLADWLVRELKLPFREAHHVTGRIVAKAAEQGVPLHRLPLAAMQEIEPRISDDVFGVLSVDKSVKSRTSYGGTAPRNVRAQAKRWLKRLDQKR